MATHTNELIHESSPYLLQHAHNPVHWFAWGDKALQAAREQDKPILVSIGYAACHWCHVMERESFENEAVAAIMNVHFINIKIDREERPDLDHIYMDAVQAIAGNGGWPLNVFLTPDARPFFGGTYFPPVKAFNRPSWTDVLLNIKEAWQNRRAELEAQASKLIDHLSKSNSFGSAKAVIPLEGGEEIFSKADCLLAASNILQTADTSEGGFGKPPKFPQTFSIRFLLQHAHFFKNEPALKQAELSLQKMINGGIYDQLAGGMARYSTDGEWLVPHFEKMLYDNALLVLALCEAGQLTENKIYEQFARKTLDWIEVEMKNPAGGYYAAIDADSEGVEGKFYVWTKYEIEQALGVHAPVYCAYYNITDTGNWEANNILHVTRSIAEVAATVDWTEQQLRDMITSSNQLLLTIRNNRVRPATDDKILLGWNALLVSAFCNAYAAFGEKKYKEAAIELFEFIETAFPNIEDGSLFHTYKNGKARFPAFLDDYANYIDACIKLQEISSDQRYLQRAKELAIYVMTHFEDTETDFFFFTQASQQDIVVRKIELYDGATPSANAMMAHNLLYLGVVFDERTWHYKGIAMLAALKQALIKYPGSFGIWALGMQQLVMGYNEIAVTGDKPEKLLGELLAEYMPNRILQSSNKPVDLPLLRGKAFSGGPYIYLCRQYNCFAPVNSVAEMLRLSENK